jgi:hypothetical protein
VEVKLLTRSGTGSLTGRSEIVETYLVIADKSDGVPDVAAAPGIVLGTPHPDAPALFLEEIRPRLQEIGKDKNVWHVELVYRMPEPAQVGSHDMSAPPSGGHTGMTGDPTTWPIEISITGRKQEVAATKDRDGRPLVNSAQGVFSEPMFITRVLGVITFTKYYAPGYPVLNLVLAMTNRVNDSNYRGFEQHTLLCESVDATFTKVNNFWVWQCRFVVVYNQEKWIPTEILDAGYFYLDAEGRKKLAVDDRGNPLGQPVLLDGRGRLLPQGAQPVYLTFRFYDVANFSTWIG